MIESDRARKAATPDWQGMPVHVRDRTEARTRARVLLAHDWCGQCDDVTRTTKSKAPTRCLCAPPKTPEKETS